MRVFLDAGAKSDAKQQSDFLRAYDKAALLASEAVVAELATFLNMQVQHKATPGTVSQADLKAEFVHCITVMRRDCGFPNTTYLHRVVTF